MGLERPCCTAYRRARPDPKAQAPLPPAPLRRLLPNVLECCPWRGSKGMPMRSPRAPKGGHGGSKGDLRGAKGGPLGAQGRPEGGLGGARGAQGGPRGGGRGGPRGTQGGPRGYPGGARGGIGGHGGQEGGPEAAQVAQNAIGVIKIEGATGGAKISDLFSCTPLGNWAHSAP